MIVSFCSTALYAGGDDKIGGIRAGYHSANMYQDGSALSGASSLDNFYIGYYKNNRIVPVLNWGFGVEYFKNGWAVDDNNKQELHYVSVPLNLKLKLGPVIALTGFAPSFKVAENITFLGNSTKPSGDDKSNWFDAPFFAGFGFEFLMFTIEARYHWGLVELNDEGYKNQYLQIGAGIAF